MCDGATISIALLFFFSASGRGFEGRAVADSAILRPFLSPRRLFGFLLGSSLAGSGVYYYVLQEYKASNDQLMEDIYVRLCI